MKAYGRQTAVHTHNDGVFGLANVLFATVRTSNTIDEVGTVATDFGFS